MKGMKSVLVVDDDRAHRTMLNTLLSGWGYEVNEADDGQEAMDQMLRYPWPGNVRELMNAIERAVVLSRYEYIDKEDLPLHIKDGLPDAVAGSPLAAPEAGHSLEEVEKETVLKVLEITGGNKSEAARRLGITRKTLHKKLKKYGVMQ